MYENRFILYLVFLFRRSIYFDNNTIIITFINFTELQSKSRDYPNRSLAPCHRSVCLDRNV